MAPASAARALSTAAGAAAAAAAGEAAAAGTTAATSSLAKLLGEDEFPVHFHEGKQNHLHISLVGDDHILTVIFDHRSSLGLVRLRVKRATDTLLSIFEDLAAKQQEDPGGNVFSEITDEDIDNLFSDSF